MTPQNYTRKTPSVDCEFPDIAPNLRDSYQSERASRRQEGSQHGPLMGTQKREYNVSSSFMTPDNRVLLLSPSSPSSRYSISSSSVYSSVYSDQSSQSSHSPSSEESYQLVNPLAGRIATSVSTSFGKRRLSMAYQEESSSGLGHATPRHSGIPRGLGHLLHPLEQTAHSAVTTSPPTTSRLRLHIRQQPVATRACSAGEKDRRTIDPPPILQLLLTDFNPASKTDQAILQNSRFVVCCLLYSVRESSSGGREELIHRSQVLEPPRRRHRDEGSRVHNTYHFDSRTTNEQSNQSDERYVQILSGKTYVSPFHVPYDPDPETAPGYPSSSQGHGYHHHHHRHNTAEPSDLSATFFVFADLSVRTAGKYRLKFRLMDWGLAAESGAPQPILAECFSEPFRVYSSKDFPGMGPSSPLTWNLRKMGMMELKPRDGKGKGVGKKEKRRVDEA